MKIDPRPWCEACGRTPLESSAMALRRINVVVIDRLGLFALLEDWPPDERESETQMSKRVQATLALSSVNQDDPKDTVDVTIKYGDMSIESYQLMQKGIAAKLFEMGDAALANALAAEAAAALPGKS